MVKSETLHAKPSKLPVQSSKAQNDGKELTVDFEYRKNEISRDVDGNLLVRPTKHEYTFKTTLKPAKTGVMLVGLGGNNGSTLLGGLIANREKMQWRTRNGEQRANYYGSITQASTVHLGYDGRAQIYVPFNHILPMVDPNSLAIDGWDINNANLYKAMKRAKVFEPELQDKLRPFLEEITPRPSVYYPDFIASNQGTRANHVIPGTNKNEHLQQIRRDIGDFRERHQLDCVIVLWTASTERFATVRPGLNQTAEELFESISNNDPEVAPSQMFAIAALLENAHYINGSPQNTLVPGVVDLATKRGLFIGGDDFKSGQTKLKSALVDCLISSGLKPESIVSYNHLGNNDGKNLGEKRQFRSKEVTKSGVLNDLVASNTVLYKEGENPDHVIVIKYVPFVGDSKRALDEYICSIFMGGLQTMVIHNTCEDSLLAAPLILDLVLITELCTRIRYTNKSSSGQSARLESVLSILSCLLKAPVVPRGTPVCNALMKQYKTLTRLVCICAGLDSDADVQLEFFTKLDDRDEEKGRHINGLINGTFVSQ